MIESTEGDIRERFKAKIRWINGTVTIIIIGLGLEAFCYFMIKVKNASDKESSFFFGIEAIFKSVAHILLA